MRERPILFSGPMVRAILAGTKTQTRRVLKQYQNAVSIEPHADYPGEWSPFKGAERHASIVCPYGQPGDRLWVRESGWERPERTPRMMREGADTWARYYYDADGEDDIDFFKRNGFRRQPSIHMPRWASRITLAITGVRVERLQDINTNDCYEEGIERPTGPFLGSDVCARDNARNDYRKLWDSINAKRAPWASNPWVWVIQFRRIMCPT